VSGNRFSVSAQFLNPMQIGKTEFVV
jgi:hypothetical protein